MNTCVCPCAGGPDNQVHFEGYQVSNQCMALVRDECLLPCKDAPELGYVKESSPEQYVPDVFFKVRPHTCSSKLYWHVTKHNISNGVWFMFLRRHSDQALHVWLDCLSHNQNNDIQILCCVGQALWVASSRCWSFFPPSILKDKDKFGNDVTFLARPLPVEYLIIDVSIVIFYGQQVCVYFLFLY